MDRWLKISTFGLGIVIVGIILAEIAIGILRPTPNPTQQQMQQALSEAQEIFSEQVDNISSVNKNLTRNIADAFDRTQSINENIERLLASSLISPAAVYLNSTLRIWDGFLPEMMSDFSSESDRNSPTLISLGDATYLRAHSTAIIDSARRVSVVHYLQLTGPNPSSVTISDIKRIYLPREWNEQLSYPVQFNFDQGEAINANTPLQESLYIDGRQVGYISTSPQTAGLNVYKWQQSTRVLRTSLLLLFSIVVLIWVITFTHQWSPGRQFMARIPLVIILGLVSYFLGGPEQITNLFSYVGLSIQRPVTVDITDLLIQTILLTIAVLCIRQVVYKQGRYFGIDWYPRTIIISALFGIFFGWISQHILLKYTQLAAHQSIEVVSSNLLPSVETYLFTLGFSSAVACLIALGLWGFGFILNSESEHTKLSMGTSAFGILSVYLATILGGSDSLRSTEIILLIGCGATALFFGYLFLKYRKRFTFISRLRIILGASLILTLVIFPVNHHLNTANKEEIIFIEGRELLEEIALFAGNEQLTTGYDIQYRYAPGNYHMSVFNGAEQRLTQSWNPSVGIDVQQSRLTLNEVGASRLQANESIHRAIQGADQRYNEIIHYFDHLDVYVRLLIPQPSADIILFGVSRLFFSLMLTYLTIYIVIRLLRADQLLLFDTRERLQSRILDSYVMATMIFLVIIIIASSLFIRYEQNSSAYHQSEDTARDVITTIQDELNNEISRPVLNYLSDRYNINLEAYRGFKPLASARTFGSEISAPQPVLPYSVYTKMNEDYQTQQHEQLLVTEFIYTTIYHRLRSSRGSNSPTIIKISARESRNAINEYLIEVISSLIAIYVLIFTLFIGVAYLISNYLSRPLRQLLNGLKRISSGNLDTLVPVQSQDEVGELANAYNFMIFRLKDLQQELAEAEREAAWSEMARQVAHEIKNPLTPMRLSVQSLQRKVMDEHIDQAKLKEAITNVSDTLVEQIDSLKAIATDFSRFAEPVSRNFENLNLNQLLASLSKLYQHDQHIRLYVETPESPLIIKAVEDDLKRVFINLIKNSIEAMPNGGVINISAYRHNEHAYIEITDNGKGIALELQKHIFQPNFSTKTSGTGIGLAISRKVIEAHHGSIDCASVPDSGTTFTIAIPVIE